MTDEVRKVPLVIVGGGPAGLTAAIYAARAQLAPVVAMGEVLNTEMPGGQLMLTTDVENYPGFPEGVAGPELMEKFKEQAKRFGAELIDEYATDFDLPQGGPFKFKIGGKPYESEALILANGARAKWLEAPEEEKFVNKGISACATCDGPLKVFRGAHIFVVGGGDTACEESLFLTNFASKVTMLVRRDVMRASKVMISRVEKNEKIEILWNTEIKGYVGNDKFIEALKLHNNSTKTDTEVPCGGVFMAIGHEPNTHHLKGSAVEMDAEGYIKTHENIYTNIDGVFAAGDVHDKIYRQAVSAAGIGCMAGIAASRWLEEKHDS